MAQVTRMQRETTEDDDIRMSSEDHEDSGVSMDGSPLRNSNAQKKARQSRLFDTTTLDSGRVWFSQEARRFSSRATNLIVQIPALQLRRIAQTSSVHSIRSETQHFVGIATLHGPLRIYRSRGLYRLFWIAAVIFSCAMMLYQTYKLVEIYVERSIVSQVSFLQPEEGMPFPIITLCHPSYVNKHNIEEFKRRENVSDDFILFVLQSIMDIGTLSTFVDQRNLTRAHDEYKKHLERNPHFTINNFFRSSSLTCSDILRICSIGSEEFECCRHTKVVMTDKGHCYQINLEDHPYSNTTRIGVNSGLQIYANHRKQNYGEEDNMKEMAGFFVDNEIGFRYFVHSKKDYPFITSEGVGVQIGHRTFSAISLNRFVLMNTDEGGTCIDDWPDEITSKDLSLFGNEGIGEYSSTKCVALCLGTFFYDACNCTPFAYNYNGTFPTCTVYQNYYECLNKTLNISINASANEIMKRVNPPCLNSCKMECQRWDYQIFNSYTQPFSRSALGYMIKHEKLRGSKLGEEEFVGIDIYYRDIAYTEYEQVHTTSMSGIWSKSQTKLRYTIPGSLGGNMGLFLGMSLVSFIEVIIYLCKISWLFVSRKRRQHMMAKREHLKQKKKGTSGIIGAAMKPSGPSNKSSASDASLFSSKLSSSSTMGNRLKKFADSIRKLSIELLWPKQGDFQEMRDTAESPQSNKPDAEESVQSYYLNNLIDERTYGMGRAANARQQDFVELEIEVGSRSSNPNGERTIPATVKRSRTLSISVEDKKVLARELEKRRPTYVSLEISESDLKSIRQRSHTKTSGNFFQRSLNRLAGNSVKHRDLKLLSKSTNPSPTAQKTFGVDFSKVNQLTLSSSSIKEESHFAPSWEEAWKSTKLMAFNKKIRAKRSSSLIPEEDILKKLADENTLPKSASIDAVTPLAFIDSPTMKYDVKSEPNLNLSASQTNLASMSPRKFLSLDEDRLDVTPKETPKETPSILEEPTASENAMIEEASPSTQIQSPGQWNLVTRIDIFDTDSLQPIQLTIDPDVVSSSSSAVTSPQQSNPYSIVDLTTFRPRPRSSNPQTILDFSTLYRS